MSDRPQNEDFDAISEQAADWLILVRAGEMSDQERLDYVHWLKTSPAHIEAVLDLVSMEYMLRETNAGGLIQPPEAQALLDEMKVLELPSSQQADERELKVPAQK